MIKVMTGEQPQPIQRARLLLYIAGGLVFVHLVVVVIYFGDILDVRSNHSLAYWHISIFDLDEEESFGTWFSVIILFYAGRLLLERSRRIREMKARWYWWWFVLAIGFHVLSIDEVVGMHEWLNTIQDKGSWTDIAIMGMAFVGLVYLPFLKALQRKECFLFLLAAAIYLGGAIGVERATDIFEEKDMLNTLVYNLWTCLEEGLEMFGVILFIHTLEKTHISRANERLQG